MRMTAREMHPVGTAPLLHRMHLHLHLRGDVCLMLCLNGLQLLLLYVPPLARFFGTTPLAAHDLLICVGFSLIFFLFLELEKIWRAWRRQASSDA